MASKNYNSIDLFKFVMAIFVIAIHTFDIKRVTDVVILQKIYSSIVACAVPFFFISLGFFIEQHMMQSRSEAKDTKVIESNIARLSKMYIRLSILYLPLAIGYDIKRNVSVLKSVLLY